MGVNLTNPDVVNLDYFQTKGRQIGLDFLDHDTHARPWLVGVFHNCL